jgi:hypothetical protein
MSCNTVRTRRCSYSNKVMTPPTNDNQMYYDRSHISASDNMFATVPMSKSQIQARDWTNRDYLDEPGYNFTEAYGSGLSRREKDMMVLFDNNLAIGSIPFNRPPRFVRTGNGVPVSDYPSTTRYGLDYYTNMQGGDFADVPY